MLAAAHRPSASIDARSRATVALPTGPATGPHRSNTLDLRFTRPVGRPRAHGRRGGVHIPDTRPGVGHPARPRRPGRPGRGADRDRQDGRLRPADPRPPPPPGQHQLLPCPPSRPSAHPRPDPRARDAGRRERADLWPDRPAALDRRLRRHPDGSPDQGAPRRHRDPRCDAGSPARPRRAEGRQPRPGRDPRPRRGRPDARHGLPAGHPEDHRAAPGQAPEPDVLGRRSRTTSGACRAGSCAIRPRSRSRRGTPPSRPSTSWSTRSIATGRKRCSPT